MANNNGFIAVNWNPNQVLDEASLDQINANTVWLRNNMVRGLVDSSVQVDYGVKIFAGKAPFNFPSPGAWMNVDFPSWFTNGCQPVVTASVHSSMGYNEWGIRLTGKGANTAPDHTGFAVAIVQGSPGREATSGMILSGVLNYIAIGW